MAQKKKSKAQKKKRAVATARDPITKVEVAIHNDEGQTSEGEAQIEMDILGQADLIGDADVKVTSVTKKVEFEFNGRRGLSNRKRDGLDMMLSNGTITERQFLAARAFQEVFDWAGKCDYTSVQFDDVTGDGMSRGDFMDKRIHASKKLEELYDLVGGSDKIGSYALVGLLGWRKSLADMVAWQGHGANVWRGALLVALDNLASALFDGRCTAKKVVGSKR